MVVYFLRRIALTIPTFLALMFLTFAAIRLVPGDPVGEAFPIAVPEHEREWDDLVRVFLDGGRAAAVLGQQPERLAHELQPGVTLADELNCVAVHNAYHLGKIVALRQRIGAWPPPGAAAES